MFETGGILKQSTDANLCTTRSPATSAVDLRLNLISFFRSFFCFTGDAGKLVIEFGFDVLFVGANDV